MRSIIHQERIHVFKQSKTSLVTENKGLLGRQGKKTPRRRWKMEEWERQKKRIRDER